MNEHINNSPNAPSDNILPSIFIAISVVLFQIILAIGAYSFLPERIPIHWSITGQINGYASKNIGAFVLPLVSIGVFLLFYFLIVTRNLSGENNERTRKISSRFLIAVLVFILLMQCVTFAIALGINLNVRFILGLLLSSLYIYVGNSLGKLQRNYWAGIRTPWALANDTVWERTHRLGGWLFVIAGMIGFVSAFIPAINIWGVVVPIFLVVIILYIYSYVTYQNVEKRGGVL